MGDEMVVADYLCPECGKVARRGETVRLLNDPKSAYLELNCGDGDHVPWGVSIRCTGCGGIPSYSIRGHETRRVPLLHCCGMTWIPMGYEDNPFLDERAI